MSICIECNGDGEVTFGGYGEGIPFDSKTCPRCEGSGQEPQPPTSGEWDDMFDYYSRTGHDTDEAATLADRDMVDPREEALVYY